MTQLPTGLTAAEVAKKTQEGLHNDYETKTSKSTAAIIKDNLLTLFNFQPIDWRFFICRRRLFQHVLLSDYFCEYHHWDQPRIART